MMDRRMAQDLDNYITGHYGEDQFKGEEPEPYANVLVINSYAGSLTQACIRSGLNILASLEDHGYGLDTQSLNFPELLYVPSLPWPDPGMPLTDAIVVAHPPCAAFSAQNNSANRGVDSTHFDCTRRVYNYACDHRAAAILIESVTGAYAGAETYYDKIQAAGDYHIFKVLQNAVTFGVPQWRPRYWTVLVRTGLLKHSQDQFILHHKRRYVTLGQALGDGIDGPVNPYTERYWAKQLQGLKEGGLSNEQIKYMLENETGHLARVLSRLHDLSIPEAKARFNISSFDSHVFTLLPEHGFAHTVMCVSNWLWRGRPVNVPELNVIAGFPAEYKFAKLADQKCYLSKGVAPPVAVWLIGELRANLLGWKDLNCQGDEHMYLLTPGDTADLRVKRGDVRDKDLFADQEEV
jgi:site-specific DNA-cytosine methylase